MGVRRFKLTKKFSNCPDIKLGSTFVIREPITSTADLVEIYRPNGLLQVEASSSFTVGFIINSSHTQEIMETGLPDNFRKSEKQYHVLKMISDNKCARYTDIIKFAYELSNGPESFDKVKNRGYWSGVFVEGGRTWYGGYPRQGWVSRLCYKNPSKQYFLNKEGEGKLEELRKKFGPIDYDSQTKANVLTPTKTKTKVSKTAISFKVIKAYPNGPRLNSEFKPTPGMNGKSYQNGEGFIEELSFFENNTEYFKKIIAQHIYDVVVTVTSTYKMQVTDMNEDLALKRAEREFSPSLVNTESTAFNIIK